MGGDSVVCRAAGDRSMGGASFDREGNNLDFAQFSAKNNESWFAPAHSFVRKRSLFEISWILIQVIAKKELAVKEQTAQALLNIPYSPATFKYSVIRSAQ